MGCTRGPGWSCGSATVDYSVRRIVLLIAAGAAGVGASVWGFVAWWGVPAGARGSVLFLLTCFLAALTFPVFVLYLRRSRTGVTLVWLLLSGSWFAGFLERLHACLRQPCTTVDTLRIAGQTVIREPYLWLQIAAAVCLTLDYSNMAVEKLRASRESAAGPPPPGS